jgi:nitrate reductase beta subunit
MCAAAAASAFGNGCSEGVSETSLFGSEKKRTIPIKAGV